MNNSNEILFDSLVQTLRPRMERLYGLLDAHPQPRPGAQMFHPWDRPGLELVPSRIPSNSYRWDISLPGYAGLSISRRRRDDRTISLWLGSQQGTQPPFILDVDRPFAMQDPRTQCRLSRLFGHAGALLERAQIAILNGCPMRTGVSWDKHLSEQAGHISGVSELEQFGHWVATWGGEQTQAIWTITNAMHDAQNDFETWKAAFVHGMQSTHAPPLERLDTDVFEQ